MKTCDLVFLQAILRKSSQRGKAPRAAPVAAPNAAPKATPKVSSTAAVKIHFVMEEDL